MRVRLHCLSASATQSHLYVGDHRFYGITNLQTFLYFRTFPDDKWWNKVGVFWLWYVSSSYSRHVR